MNALPGIPVLQGGEEVNAQTDLVTAPAVSVEAARADRVATDRRARLFRQGATEATCAFTEATYAARSDETLLTAMTARMDRVEQGPAPEAFKEGYLATAERLLGR